MKPKLTSAEIAHLWNGYMNNSLARCVLDFYMHHVKDPDIQPVVQFAFDTAIQNLNEIKQLFESESFPVPHGFTDKDVNLSAPQLFSDSFKLEYLKHMANASTRSYTDSMTLVARPDVREVFQNALNRAVKLLNMAVNALLTKGLYIRPPFIEYPTSVEYVHKEGFMNGIFGDRRPLNSLEISYLFLNSLSNTVGKSLMIGFSQTARSKEVVEFLVRGRDIADKHIDVISAILKDDNLPAPVSWDTEVTNSTVAPFSDKLMLFHTVALIAAGLISCAVAQATSFRRDLAPVYERLRLEIATYADDGAELLIKNGWMEKIPTALDRDALVRT